MKDGPLSNARRRGRSECPQQGAPSRAGIARDARSILDRAIRAVALGWVRMEDAGRVWRLLDDSISQRAELSQELASLSTRVSGAAGCVARVAREEGVPPERVVSLLKQIVESNALEPTLEQEIGRQVVESGIDAYYAAA